MSIEITVAGEPRNVEAGTTAADLFTENREIVVARVNDVLVDLSHEVAAGDTVVPVSIHEEEGLNVLRHSAAHVMAQAVQEYRKTPSSALVLTSLTASTSTLMWTNPSPPRTSRKLRSPW